MSEIDKQDPNQDITSKCADDNADREQAPEPKSDPGSEMAGPPHEELAADAAAHLERSGGSLQGLGGNPEEIERQAASLIVWARGKNLILPAEHTAGLFKHQSTTAEHQVFYRSSDNRAVKCTYAGTPLFYLRRLELMNRAFKSGLRLEGIMLGKSLIIGATGDQASIVVSQPWIRAADRNHPHPSGAEIDEFMESLGFAVLSRSYYGWRRKADGIIILDARADNFVKSAEGVVPIDLVISEEPARC